MTQYQPKRVSYPQNWQAYDKAQCSEQVTFMKLLSALCREVSQPGYEFGRPTLPLADMVFCSALKVYTTFSLRRFMGAVQKAEAEGHIDSYCSYSSVSNYMRKPSLTPILHQLIELSSLPLKSIETNFAVDSSGFSTSRFARYFSYKHSRDLKYKKWIKAHLMCGTATNIVTSVDLSEEHGSDYAHFQSLVERTARAFDVREVYADKAYSGRSNYDIVERVGGFGFIPFKSNSTNKVRGSQAWSNMYHYFMFRREEFMKHYHKRSNCETVFHMIKAKFRDNIRSKDKTAQCNEILLKILCHNICVVIQEINGLGIGANFFDLKSGT